MTTSQDLMSTLYVRITSGGDNYYCYEFIISLLLICIVMQYQLICVFAGLLYVFSGDFQRDQGRVVFSWDLFGQLIHDFV